jgi:hypothetical protein
MLRMVAPLGFIEMVPWIGENRIIAENVVSHRHGFHLMRLDIKDVPHYLQRH